MASSFKFEPLINIIIYIMVTLKWVRRNLGVRFGGLRLRGRRFHDGCGSWHLGRSR